MKKVVYFLVASLVVMTIYAIMSRPSIPKTNDITEPVKNTQNKKHKQKVKEKEPSFKSIVEKEVKTKKQDITKQEKEPKEEKEERTESNLPPEYDDYIPLSSMDVAGSTVSIITDKKEEQSEDTPPSVPYLVSGKVDGESFTITLPATQSSRTNIVVIKTESGKTITKPIPPQELLKKGMIDIGEVDNSDDTNEQNQKEKTKDSGSIVPPQAPRI